MSSSRPFERGSARLARPEGLRDSSGQLRESVRVGRYQVLRWLRDTALAHVYQCERDSAVEGRSPVPVELHVLASDHHPDPTRVAEFVRRGRIGRRFRHRGLPRVLEVAIGTSVPYAVHAWGPGPTLHQLQTEKGWGRSLDLRMVARLGFDTADALAEAYLAEDEQGQPLAVVHGGLSPDRVVLAPQGFARVIDFGTPSGSRYHAPELLAGGEPTPRSDVFALGVVLYALVTGQHAWPGHDVDPERTDRLAPPSLVREDLPSDLEAIVLACLETRPADRPRDCIAVAEALSGWLEHHGGPVPDEALAAWEVGDAPSDGPRLLGTRPATRGRIEAPKGLLNPLPEDPTWPRPAALSERPTVPDVWADDPDAVTVPGRPALAVGLAPGRATDPPERVTPLWAVVLLVSVATVGGIALAWLGPLIGLPTWAFWEHLIR